MSAMDESANIEQELASREGFTSELFKLELQGIPKYLGIGQLKKLFQKQDLRYHKLKPAGKNATYMFVNFQNEEDRDKAIDKLNGLVLKGRTLKAFKAKPAKDPMLKKAEEVKVDTRTVRERLRDAVCPLSDVEYDDQIKRKSEVVSTLLSSLKEEVLKGLNFAKNKSLLEETSVAVAESFVRSPITDGYRNKCEFSVGFHPETKEVTVGFRLSSYKKGNIDVVGVSELPIVSNVVSVTTSLNTLLHPCSIDFISR
jgi:tRNA (uracil-5-)-methyltransferase